MKVLLSGGGTGGHITPLLAVAQKLKAADPTITIIYVGERSSKFAAMTKDSKVLDQHYQVYTGKFRRYYGESWLRRLFAVKTNLLNLRDAVLAAVGTVQSYFLLRKVRPDVILLKGGFVGVPIGLAASRLKIPFVTHDSDAVPGLANRIVARWATYHATALPPAEYNYPPAQTRQVGVLVSEDYQPVTGALQKQYRQELKLPTDAEVMLVTGGSGGAAAINKAIKNLADDLLTARPKLHIIHQVGHNKEGVYQGYTHERLVITPLLYPFYQYSGAADVIVMRAGATNLAEFGVQAKACIVIPNPLLTGGHQTKNAEILAKKGAVEVVNETDLPKGRELLAKINELLDKPAERSRLGERLHQITIADASQRLAALLIDVVAKGTTKTEVGEGNS